jgi:hypothetical protein
MEHDLEKLSNLKLILSAFEQLSGLNINFHKSEWFYFGEAQDDANLYDESFGCGLGSFPICELRIPIHHWRLRLAELKIVEERLKKHLSSWKGKLLSGRKVGTHQFSTHKYGWITSNRDSSGREIVKRTNMG